jgi:hypothetical protein
MTIVLAEPGYGRSVPIPRQGGTKNPARVNPESEPPKRRGGSRLGRSAATGNSAAAVRKGSKQALLLDLLKRKSGAS